MNELTNTTEPQIAYSECYVLPFVNQILNTNCLDLLSQIANDTIDLTVTSPPYNLGVKHHTGNNVFEAYDEYIDDMPEEYQLTTN